ncbi:MAG: RNA-binding cell elongation regulator Jag/EloR [Tepidiformaceae bacterium]
MDQAEASGKTVDDALNRALAQLNARREDVEFVVLDEGQKGGLFGRGARAAVVRVERISNSQPAEMDRGAIDTRIARGRDQGRGQRGGRDARPMDRGSDRGPRPPRGDAPRSDAPRPRERGRGGRAGLETSTPKLTEDDFLRAPRYSDETSGAAADPAAPAERGGRNRGERPAAPPRDREPRPERDRRRREDEPEVVPDINAEEVDFAANTVDDLLRILDIPAELTIREPLTPGDGKGMALAVIDIKGQDLGLLIGRRGDTLAAFQYIVNIIVSRRFPERPGVTIDVEHYRHRREEHIVSVAQRMADRVRETGSPITLEPMTAAERRLVHIALADDPELWTNSIGEGENRKVVISTRE